MEEIIGRLERALADEKIFLRRDFTPQMLCAEIGYGIDDVEECLQEYFGRSLRQILSIYIRNHFSEIFGDDILCQ